jgi:hypothetical protein
VIILLSSSRRQRRALLLTFCFGPYSLVRPRILPSRPARSERRRAQRRSRMARSATVRLVLEGREHDGTTGGSGRRRVPCIGQVLLRGPWRVRCVASTYIRQLRSGLPRCCLHGRSRRWDGAQLMNGRLVQPICEMEEQPRIRPARHTRVGCRNSAHLWHQRVRIAPCGTRPSST